MLLITALPVSNRCYYFVFQMAPFHRRNVSWHSKFCVPAATEALYWSARGAESYEMVHILYQLGLHGDRPPVRLGCGRGAPVPSREDIQLA